MAPALKQTTVLRLFTANIVFCLFFFVCTIFVSVFILKLFSSNAPFVVTVPANRKLFEDCRGVHSEKRYKQTLKYIYDDLE